MGKAFEGKFVCGTCHGLMNKPSRRTPGWIWVVALGSLFVFWPMFFVAVFLSAFATEKSCPSCKGKVLLPVGSPKAKQLLAQRGV
jgi:hypothetical protein